MKRNIIVSFIGGLLGLVVGVLGGCFLGLVVGGTLLGGLEIYKQNGFEGYELAAYVGAILGAIFDTPLGVKLPLRIDKKIQKKVYTKQL